MLAWMLVDNGDQDEAVRVGNAALDLAGQIRSQRVIDRLTPLRRALERHPNDGDLRDLVQRIRGLSRAGTRPRDQLCGPPSA